MTIMNGNHENGKDHDRDLRESPCKDTFMAQGLHPPTHWQRQPLASMDHSHSQRRGRHRLTAATHMLSRISCLSGRDPSSETHPLHCRGCKPRVHSWLSAPHPIRNSPVRNRWDRMEADPGRCPCPGPWKTVCRTHEENSHEKNSLAHSEQRPAALRLAVGIRPGDRVPAVAAHASSCAVDAPCSPGPDASRRHGAAGSRWSRICRRSPCHRYC